MTNNEIDKLLLRLNKDSLEDVKNYLIREKEKNIQREKQSCFERYLTNNKFGYDIGRIPKIYVGENIQKFTNGVSLYIINSNYFNTNTSRLLKVDRKTHYSHRFEFVNLEKIQKYVDSIIKYYSDEDSFFDLETDGKFTIVSYYNKVTNTNETRKFDKSEIDTARCILGNPTFKISNSSTVLKAESDIGSAYILGYGSRKEKI